MSLLFKYYIFLPQLSFPSCILPARSSITIVNTSIMQICPFLLKILAGIVFIFWDYFVRCIQVHTSFMDWSFLLCSVLLKYQICIFLFNFVGLETKLCVFKETYLNFPNKTSRCSIFLNLSLTKWSHIHHLILFTVSFMMLIM